MAEQTINLGLYVWDTPLVDTFDPSKLAANWVALDAHDHTSGRGAPLGAGSLANGSVGTAQLANGAVTQPKLGPQAVGTGQIADGAVGTVEIADGAVTAAKIAAGAIGTAALGAGISQLGDVKLWYSATAGAVPGGFWEVMDGRAWSTITNLMGPGATQLSTGNIPDMRGVFPIGAAVNGVGGPAMGTTGGSATASLAHTHTVNGHAHGISAHAHNVEVAGSHSHTFQGGLTMHTRTNAFLNGISVRDTGTNIRQNALQSLYLAGWNDGGGSSDLPLSEDVAGSHAHVVDSAGGGNTDLQAPGTSSSLGGIPIVPVNSALLFVMRVR